MTERRDLGEMTAKLAAHLAAPGAGVTDADRQRAADVLAELGVPDLLAALDLAERILAAGNGFHTVARFFVDGSPEQQYLLELAERS